MLSGIFTRKQEGELFGSSEEDVLEDPSIVLTTKPIFETALEGEQLNTQSVTGLHSRVWGNFKNIRGDVSKIFGDVSGLQGYVSNNSGCATDILGNVTYLKGDLPSAIDQMIKDRNL